MLSGAGVVVDLVGCVGLHDSVSGGGAGQHAQTLASANFPPLLAVALDATRRRLSNAVHVVNYGINLIVYVSIQRDAS